MADQTEQAFSYAQDTSKQVIVLATGIITITIALLGDLKKAVHASAFWDLHLAWIFDASSVAFGVLTLMALTGHLGRGKPSPDLIYAKNVRFFFGVQVVLFVVALGFTVAFGIRAV